MLVAWIRKRSMVVFFFSTNLSVQTNQILTLYLRFWFLSPGLDALYDKMLQDRGDVIAGINGELPRQHHHCCCCCCCCYCCVWRQKLSNIFCHIFFFKLLLILIKQIISKGQIEIYYEMILIKFYILCKIILKRQCPNCGELLLCFSFCLLRYSYIEALPLPCFNDFAAYLWIRVHKYKERQLSSLIGLAL